MKTLLMTIATGERYREYAKNMLESAERFLVQHDSIVFTDDVDEFLNINTMALLVPQTGFPESTLYRYSMFCQGKSIINRYDQVFFSDADMLFVAPVGDEIFSNGITACLHPGYIGTVGTPERRFESCAAVPYNVENKYFCGGFNGGETKSFLEMSIELAWRIDHDAKRGITAIWHDESHLNRYLFERPPAKVLTPAYCYPDVKNDYYTKKWEAAGLGKIEPKLLALEKSR